MPSTADSTFRLRSRRRHIRTHSLHCLEGTRDTNACSQCSTEQSPLGRCIAGFKPCLCKRIEPQDMGLSRGEPLWMTSIFRPMQLQFDPNFYTILWYTNLIPAIESYYYYNYVNECTACCLLQDSMVASQGLHKPSSLEKESAVHVRSLHVQGSPAQSLGNSCSCPWE